MGLLADLSIPAAELYLLRFGVTKARNQVPIAAKRFRPLLEFAELEWRRKSKDIDYVLLDREPLDELTGAHFDIIRGNAEGFAQLFVWFPPRAQPSGDEARVLTRAGVRLYFVTQNNGVYNRHVSKYNR